MAVGRTTLSGRIHQLLKRTNNAIVISKDKNGWWVASFGVDWRVRYQGKGDTIEHALMNLFEVLKEARENRELGLRDWGMVTMRDEWA